MTPLGQGGDITNLCNDEIYLLGPNTAAFVGGGSAQEPTVHPSFHKLGYGYTLVADLENLHAVLATLEECQATLVLSGDHDTAHLVSVAILELRIKLNRIEDSELKALCDALLREAERGKSPHANPPEAARPPVSLKLVKS